MQLKEHQPGAGHPRSDFRRTSRPRCTCTTRRRKRSYLNFVIVGAGPTGVELAGALAEIKRTVLKREYRGWRASGCGSC